MATAEVCRRHGQSTATFYKLKAKYGGMEVSEAVRLKALEDKDAKLKRAGRLSNLGAPRPARLRQTRKPNTQIQHADSHCERGIRRGAGRSERYDIVWLLEGLRALQAVANDREARVDTAASEGGLTPRDIGILKREHVQNTPRGRRLYFRRAITGKFISIPVTPALARLIDGTPASQEFLIVSLEGC